MYLRIVALVLLTASLAGCIVVPSGRYRGRGNGYVAAPVTPGIWVEGHWSSNGGRRSWVDGHYRDGGDRGGDRGGYRDNDRGDGDRDGHRGRGR